MTEHDNSKYEPIHVDLYDSSLMSIIEDGLSEGLLKTHRVTELIQRQGGNWIVRLEYDFMKDSQERAKVQI